MVLTNQELHRFHRDGYIVVRQLCKRADMEVLQPKLDCLHEQMATNQPDNVNCSWEDPEKKNRIRQLMNSENVVDELDQILHSDAMLDIVEQLIGSNIVKFHSKLMMKAAEDGSFTPWHQDWGYWQYKHREPKQVNCMLAIDPATKENGCIRFVRGSHKQGPIDHKDFQTHSFTIGLEGGLDAYEADIVELAPGDAVFFGPLIIHGSAPNTSKQHRRCNTFAFDVINNHVDDHQFEVLRQAAVHA